MADDLRQHPQRAEHPNHRRLAPHLQQVDAEQRPPGCLPIGVSNGRDGIGNVVDGQELVGEFEVGHLARRQRTLPGMGGVERYWVPLGAGRHLVRLNGRVYEAGVRACSGGWRATSTTPRSKSNSRRERW